ncbi:hypothetical protein [Streptomyces ardesiacus]|uniref:hypothetical protein n=1 Tax=Streptomyces ardesiacus TaxID=285564 RepID=UPI00368B5018
MTDQTTTEAHRLALSEALGLGTGAPWDAIRDRATELAANAQAPKELASLAMNAGRALQDEKRHYEIACQENARLRAQLAAASAVSLPSADQATLRDRIAAALMDLGHPQWDAAEGADAVLAVLPATTTHDTARRAVLTEAADRAEVVALRLRLKHDYGAANGAREVGAELRRVADETATTGAQPPATAYSDGKGRTYCIRCAPAVSADVPLTANDVEPHELCPSCGRHVVDVAAAGARQDGAQQ